MVRVIVFTWNAHKVPLCDDTQCRPIDFWFHFAERIKINRPDVIVFGSQEELCCRRLRSTMHSNFLPQQMVHLGYRLVSGQSLACGSNEAIQTSVYTLLDEVEILDYPINIYLTHDGFGSKKGALGTFLSIEGSTFLLCNLHLPKKSNHLRWLETILRKLYYGPAPDHILCFGSFNSLYLGQDSLSHVLIKPTNHLLKDELYRVLDDFWLKEGVNGYGPDFAPTCKLSPTRTESVDISEDLEETFQVLRLGSKTPNDIVLSQYHPRTNDFQQSWGWCDRILYGDIRQTNLLTCSCYERIDDPSTSLRAFDHAVVFGVYDLI